MTMINNSKSSNENQPRITPSQLDAWRRMSRDELEALKLTNRDEDVDTVLNQLCWIKIHEFEISKCWGKINAAMAERTQADTLTTPPEPPAAEPFGPQEPPNDPIIFNRKRADGTYPPLAEFFDPKPQAKPTPTCDHEYREWWDGIYGIDGQSIPYRKCLTCGKVKFYDDETDDFDEYMKARNEDLAKRHPKPQAKPKLSKAQQRALQQISADWTMPKQIHHKILEALQSKGLIDTRWETRFEGIVLVLTDAGRAALKGAK